MKFWKKRSERSCSNSNI